MEEIIKVNSVGLIYKSAESLSIKKALKMLLNKNYKASFLLEYKALEDISFSVKKGSVYGIVGNNGAGKSTLLRILSGAMSPTEGNIERRYKTINLLALGVGFTRDMTGYENIYLNGMLLGFSKKKIDEKLKDIIEYSELGDFVYKPMKTYSSGMVSRLGFSIAINLKPEVLLVDEILSVGDVKFREKSFKSIKKYIEDENTTVVIVSHSMQQIKDLCNYVVWIEKGHLIAKGDTHNILDAYSKVNNELISLEKAKDETKEKITIEGNRVCLDISTYKLCMEKVNEKRLFGRIYDSRKEIQLNDSKIEITVRRLLNDDLFIFFTTSGNDEIKIRMKIDEVRDRLTFDKYYEKPAYNKVLGEVKATGPNSFFDLKSGAMMVSKTTHFNELECKYEAGANSKLKEVVMETNHVKLLDSTTLEITIPHMSEKASSFIILSKTKLFRSFANMKTYMDYYFSSIKNNININPFFQLPEGIFTKVPYSIEPFSPNAYGYNLVNIFNTDLIKMFLAMNERFLNDLMLNSVLQLYMYGENSEGLFATDYTSTWMKKESGITAPYYDINLNCKVVQFLQEFAPYNPLADRIQPVKTLCEAICNYYTKGMPVYKLEEGILIPSYFDKRGTELSNTTLVHQLLIARMLLEGYLKYHKDNYFNIAEKIILFLANSKEKWINTENGDLFQCIAYEQHTRTLTFYGDDYIYTTLCELLKFQKIHYQIKQEYNATIKYFIDAKIKYLSGTRYDIFDEELSVATGESIEMKLEVLKLYNSLYIDKVNNAE